MNSVYSTTIESFQIFLLRPFLYIIFHSTHILYNEHIGLLASLRTGVRLQSKTCGQFFFKFGTRLASIFPQKWFHHLVLLTPFRVHFIIKLLMLLVNITLSTYTNHRFFTSITWTRVSVIVLYNITLYTLRDGSF